jgi:hypothetical protein
MPQDPSIAAFQLFCGSDLTVTLGRIESSIRGVPAERLGDALSAFGASESTLTSTGHLKRHLLDPQEFVQSVSLGAGNNGRLLDLETDRRVAEFKFIRWQGRSQTIRQNSLFKDFYLLAEDETHKKRHLYVLDTHHPLKFLNGGRALRSVLSKNVTLLGLFQSKYGEQYQTVREYYWPRQSLVDIDDVSPLLPGRVCARPSVRPGTQ